MRAIAGPAMLLAVFGGLALYRGLSKEAAPARDFLELEFAGADAAHTGSCYSLGTVLIANGIFGKTTRTWTALDKRADDAWTLNVEAVTQGYNGPVHEYQTFTFARSGDQVGLTAVEASQGRPTAIDRNIDLLLEAPNGLHSTPVDRCLKAGAVGYGYEPRAK